MEIHSTIELILEITGLVAFAFSGALAGAKKDLDVIGCVVLGTATGIGGGTLRDLILDAPVFWLSDWACYSLNVCIVASIVMYLASGYFSSKERVINWFDAVGLAIFSVQGYAKTYAITANAELALVMGVITGCGGGLVRDVCLNRQPFIFRGQMYASASLLGLGVFAIFGNEVAAFSVILVLRAAAIKYNIKLK